MNETLKVVGAYLVEAGMWKFYLAFTFFVLILVSYSFNKDKSIGDKIMVLALIILSITTGIIILIALAYRFVL